VTVRNFDRLFQPRSIAVIGASARAGHVGHVVTANLLAGGFQGPILPVNPKRAAILGVLAYPSIASLPIAPDLAVIATPPDAVVDTIAQLGAKGTRAAVVLSAGLGPRKQAMLEAARPHCLRILGSNSLGLIVPGLKLNASFAHRGAAPGGIAFASQSGALCTAVLDWAASRDIGFSAFVSVGDSDDVDFGDLLDWFGFDNATRAILLYIESVKHARKFMSAARAAARNKPVIVVKSGRVPEGSRAAASHTGALAGGDDVYDAAFKRAGMLRVFATEDLFAAAETLARAKPHVGERLGIVTNGGGPGVMAADAVVLGGGHLAKLDPATIAALDQALPANWSRANPVDIIGDAPGARYQAAVEAVLADPGVDAALVLHAPTAVADPLHAAEATIAAAKASPHNVFAAWMGEGAVAAARKALATAGLPAFETPESAVGAYLQLVQYRRNQASLIEVPASLPEDFSPDIAPARAIVTAALAEGRALLTEPEAKAVLAAFGIPTVATGVASDGAEAASLAKAMGFPVAVKIVSRDLSHKSDVGGVALDLSDAKAVKEAVDAMTARIKRLKPEARIEGFAVQAMIRRPGAYELIAGLASDPIFGPVVMFGQGGVAVEVVGDRAVALPPLNMKLAGDLIEGTRIAKLLRGFRHRPPVDRDAVKLVLIRLAQIAIDLPEVAELDINPLLADEKGVIALDARIALRPASAARPLAIRPYPKALEETIALDDGRRVLLRPIRPEDEPAHRRFFARLAPEDIRLRFFGLVRDLAPSEFARFTQIDYDREMAFIAVGMAADGVPETLGVVRAITDPNNASAEYAIIVRSDMKGHGIGRRLMDKIIRYSRERGTGEIVGEVLAENSSMLDLNRALGFRLSRGAEGGDVVRVSLKLRD